MDQSTFVEVDQPIGQEVRVTIVKESQIWHEQAWGHIAK